MRQATASIANLLREAASAKGRQELIADEGLSLSGHGAQALADSFTGLLSDNDVAYGDRVAFLCLPSARHSVAWMGTVQSGRIAVNVHVRETPEKLGAVLNWLEVRALVYDNTLSDLAQAALTHSGLRIPMIPLQQEWPETEASPLIPHPGDVAAIILSSGTTGEPKGIVHTHATLARAAVGGVVPVALEREGARVLLCMQTSFAAWTILTLPALVNGGAVIYRATFTPQGFLQTCASEAITHAPLVPTMWRMVYAAAPEKYNLSSLRLACISGEAPSRDDIQQIVQRICDRVSFMYLASETLTGSAIFCDARAMAARGKIGCVGAPAPGVELKIVDSASRDPLPVGVIGEIAIKGPSNATGYWQAPALTHQRFVDGWWFSGDLGHLDEEGELWVSGRNDNVINTGGIKVAGEEIENALLAHPGINQCAVVGQADETFGRRIEAFFVPLGVAPPAAELSAFLRDVQGLSGFKIPKVFVEVSELPTGPTGKLYRKALIRNESQAGAPSPSGTHHE